MPGADQFQDGVHVQMADRMRGQLVICSIPGRRTIDLIYGHLGDTDMQQPAAGDFGRIEQVADRAQGTEPARPRGV